MDNKELTPTKQPEVKTPPTTPWKPASYLNVPSKYRKAGFRLRWVRKEDLDKKIEEGWSVVKGEANKLAPEKTIIDGTQLDTTVQKRTLILCEISEEMAKAREAFFAKLTDDSMTTMKEKLMEETKVPGHGSRAYGTIEIKTEDRK